MWPDEARGSLDSQLSGASSGECFVRRAVPVLSGIICPGIDWSWCGLMVLLTTSKMISLASWTQVTTQSESSWQVNHKNHARCFLDKVRWWVGWGVPSIRALQSIASTVTSLLGPPDWEPGLLVCVCRPESGPRPGNVAMWQDSQQMGSGTSHPH